MQVSCSFQGTTLDSFFFLVFYYHVNSLLHIYLMDSIKRRGKKERKKENIESSHSEKRFINLAEVWMNKFQKSTQCQPLASTKWAWLMGHAFI